MSYVVKKLCYLNDQGYGEPSLQYAKKHESKEEAELVARVSGGEVFEIIEPKRKYVGPRTELIPKEKRKPKQNQSWMRDGK